GRVHISELTGLRSVEIIGDDNVVSRYSFGIHDSQQIIQLRSRNGWAATDDGNLVRDRNLLSRTDCDYCWFRARRGIAIAVSQQARQAGAAYNGLVTDYRARSCTEVHAQVVLKGRCGARRDRTDVDTRSERRSAVVRLAVRHSVESRGIRDVS